jgi:acyl-CoA thioester hydrolase
MKPFSWRARVYWEDTDAGGVVYYANYLKFLERARTEWLRSHGVSQQGLARERGILFAVMSVRLDYRRPARLDDELVVSCEARPRGAASVCFQQSIHRCGELLAAGEVRIACVDAQTFRPQRLPGFLVQAFGDEERS